MINIYTDGSCSNNPGKGGFGVVCISENKYINYVYREQCQETTNNREELKAIIKAIEFAKKNPEKDFIIYTDSSYAEQSINNWMYNWYYQNWKNSKNKTIENLDLIQTLYNYCNSEFPNFYIKKIKGHVGEVGNELADAIATGDKDKIRKIFDNNQLIYAADAKLDKF